MSRIALSSLERAQREILPLDLALYHAARDYPGGAAAIALGQIGWGLALIIANRLCDGLDGAVARARGPSDLGGYFDIVADFAFYVSIPLGFGILSAANTLPALVLVASFVLTGVSFLAFAVIAAKRGEYWSDPGIDLLDRCSRGLNIRGQRFDP